MITVKIPDDLQNKLTRFAALAGQTPEQVVIAIIEERIDHQSAYDETSHLMKSDANKKRLDKAVKDIKDGIYDNKVLIDD